jgi:hypothetical protein
MSHRWIKGLPNWGLTSNPPRNPLRLNLHYKSSEPLVWLSLCDPRSSRIGTSRRTLRKAPLTPRRLSRRVFLAPRALKGLRLDSEFADCESWGVTALH